MAVLTTSNSVDYTGNAATTAFPVPFKFIQDEDLAVVYTPSGGSPTTWVRGIDYTVLGADDDAGGTVTATVAPASGSTLAITRNTTMTQPRVLQRAGAFPPETLTDGLDQGVMMSQDLGARTGTLETSVAALEVYAAAGGAFSTSNPDYIEGSKYLKGDGSDDGANLNTAIAAGIALGIRKVRVTDGTYRINTPINLSGKLGFTIEGNGKNTKFICHTTNQPAFVLVGSLWIALKDIWIEGNQTDMPSCLVLAGRTTGDASAGDHLFEGVQLTGYSGVASYVGVSSETNTHYGNFSYENFQPGASVYCCWANNLQTTSTANPAGGTYPAISSPYAPLSNTPAGGNTVHSFFGGQMGMDSPSTDHTGTVLQIESVRGFTMQGTFMYGFGAKGIWIRGAGASFMNLVGASENEFNTDYGLYIDGTATCEHLECDGFLGGGPIYGATGSTVKNSTFRGRWSNGVLSNNADFATLLNSTVDLDGLNVQVRTKAWDNEFGKQTGTLTLPSDKRGNRYSITALDAAGSGRTVHTFHFMDDQPYDDRSSTMILNAAAVQRRPQYIAGASFTALGGTLTPNFWNGSFWDITLSGNLTVANWTPITGGPSGNSGLAQDGADLIFCFVQDGTGGRTVTWGNSYKGMSQWAIDPTPGAISTLHFVLRADGHYWLVAFNSNGQVPISATNITSTGTLFTSGSRRKNRLVVSASLTLSSLYEVVYVDTAIASGNVVLSLPTAASVGTGAMREVMRSLDISHSVSVAPTGGDFLAYGASNAIFFERGANAVFRSDGVNTWELVRFSPGQMAVAANYQMLELTGQVLVDTSGGARTITLPVALTSIRTLEYIVTRKSSDTNNLIVSAGASTIKGAGSVTLTTADACLRVICDSSQWYPIGKA